MRTPIFFALVLAGALLGACQSAGSTPITVTPEPPASAPPPNVDAGEAGPRCIQRIMCLKGTRFDMGVCQCVPIPDAAP